MPLSGFHPAVTRWFGERFSAPTEPQRHAWPVIQAGRDALIAAPTGSGKTFAAFLAAIDSLVRQGLDGPLPDETHAVARAKRGSPLALSLERLDRLAGRRLQRIGLSATQKPIEEIARFLIGNAPRPTTVRESFRTPHAPCEIVDSGHARRLDLALEIPSSPLEAVMAAEVWEELYDRLAQLIGEH